MVAELVALDLDALAALVSIEHVASPSSTSMRATIEHVAVVAQLDLDALAGGGAGRRARRGGDAVVADLVIAGVVAVVTIEHVAVVAQLDLDALAGRGWSRTWWSPRWWWWPSSWRSTSMRSPAAVAARVAELAAVDVDPRGTPARPGHVAGVRRRARVFVYRNSYKGPLHVGHVAQEHELHDTRRSMPGSMPGSRW